MKWLSRLGRRFTSARALCLALLFALMFLRTTDPGPLEELRLRAFDIFQVIKPRDATSRPVVIVDIDEVSLQKLGQFPWPRTRIADMITRLTRLGAAAIAFDVVFSEPDRLSPALAADVYRDLDEETRNKLRSLPSNDQIMADAMRPSRVVLGQTGLPTVQPEPDVQLPFAGVAALGGDPKQFVYEFPGLLRNIPILENAAAGRGVFSIRTERDGIVRRVPMVVQAQGNVLPSLSFETLRVATGSSTILVRMDAAGIKGVALPGFEMPTDRNGQLWIHFAPHDQARFVSALDLLEGRVAADRVSRRLVLIGTSAAGLLDLKTTPNDPVMPGVEVHAQVLESILSNSMLSAPNYAVVTELGAAFVLGVAIIALAPILSPIYLLLFGIGFIALLVGTSWYLFAEQKLLIDFTFPLMSSLLIYLTLVFTNFVKEQAQRRQIRSAFGQYLSPTLVEQLAQSPEKLVLGGEARDMTIMFSDVRGFTTISEIYKDDPQGLTALMNSFLTPLTNAIIDRKGTIDKYMGDAIMAFWNAPIDDAEHEINACRAAIDMLRRVDDLNAEREAEARENGQTFIPIRIGVGINTGRCVVGNMGSDLRFDYSVLGDSVNLASRLEGRSKAYGAPIIIGAATAGKAAGQFATLELDLITVKGKTEPERVFAILGGEDVAAGADIRKLSELTATMLSCYRKRDWSGALEALHLCRHTQNNFGLDEIYNLYLARIQSFQEKGPPDDWDGVFAVETK